MNKGDGYPASEGILRSWTDTGSRGVCEIGQYSWGDPITIEWKRYRFADNYYFGDQFIGVFSLGGRVLRVTEIYKDVAITSRGRQEHRWEYQSEDGVCCTELVETITGCQDLFLDLDSEVIVRQERDHSTSDIDIERFDLRGVFDLQNHEASLHRSRWRDSSRSDQR